MPDKKKLFSLRAGPKGLNRVYFATLAEAISAYKSLDEDELDGTESLRFKGWVLAEGKELTELLDD